MASPTSREEFKEYCLRRLGKPVISINVDDEQVEDRIDDALKYYWEYHFEGSEKIYYKHKITEIDKQRKYITLPENIMGVVKIFDLTSISNVGNMFDVRYQIALNDLYTLTSHSMIPYFMTMQHLQFIEDLLIGHKPIRYSRHKNRLNVDMDWNVIADDNYLMVEAWSIIDPEIYEDVWGDRWLGRYTTALIKKQWGENLKKFSGMQMPGGITFNGQQIWNEATDEISKLEDEMLDTYSIPNGFIVG